MAEVKKEYDRKHSVHKAIRFPDDIHDRLTKLRPRNKSFSMKVIELLRVALDFNDASRGRK